MKINTGRGTIPLITLVGIWSVSALTSLPGLAVSPILGQLTTIFPYATELDIQMQRQRALHRTKKIVATFAATIFFSFMIMLIPHARSERSRWYPRHSPRLSRGNRTAGKNLPNSRLSPRWPQGSRLKVYPRFL